MAIITFTGLIVSWGAATNLPPQLVVCCASRINAKDWRIISLEGAFAGGAPDLPLKIGKLEHGKAKLLKIWDGSICVEFLKEGFAVLASDSLYGFSGEPLKYVYNPRAGRKIALAAKDFYHFRLDKSKKYRITGRLYSYPCSRLPLWWPASHYSFARGAL